MIEEELARMEQVVHWRMRRWAGHPDYEDLIQEGMIAAWQALEGESAGERHFAFNTLAGKAADCAALDFLRTKKATRRLIRPGNRDDPEFVPIDAIIQREEWDPDVCPHDKRFDLPRQEDFGPDLIDRLTAQEIVDEALALCRENQRELIIARYLEDQTAAAMSKERGISEAAVHWAVNRGLDHYRTRHGFPLAPDRRKTR